MTKKCGLLYLGREAGGEGHYGQRASPGSVRVQRGFREAKVEGQTGSKCWVSVNWCVRVEFLFVWVCIGMCVALFVYEFLRTSVCIFMSTIVCISVSVIE